jgi:hypothetical protein
MPRDMRAAFAIPHAGGAAKEFLTSSIASPPRESGRARFGPAVDELLDRHVAPLVKGPASAAGAACGEFAVDLLDLVEMNSRRAGRTTHGAAAEGAAARVLEGLVQRVEHVVARFATVYRPGAHTGKANPGIDLNRRNFGDAATAGTTRDRNERYGNAAR